ncbi:type II RES/Xre toxin-antitoxin system antitoxin [Phyllobacterium lublinensis]|uniref:type II RES/Xre toxin-antitoxin system antitoxin n=1 Tax=Phyllobacterium lublinensis TaxID=2875708 RepID=UPI001CCE1DA5|nr:antitoxin Xre/MbcA/ParS toxin-binding domain-containing protein [Phyllobacterium sp. 2063]MBZ9656912.1 DUF2384 domain-containing protein [Phyllobacterium sp. 2063]
MAALAINDPRIDRPSEIRRVTDLLGGKESFASLPKDSLDVHDMLLQGLPFQGLAHLIGNLSVIRKTVFLEQAIGMSSQTFQRRRVDPLKPLNREQSSRVWKFAEILSEATIVFGSQADAECWLEQPAIGLNRRRPIDLLATIAGIEILHELLGRLEYGVYA